MSMYRFSNLPRPVRICAIYSLILLSILGFYWLLSGGRKADMSPYRSELYLIYFAVIPLVVTTFLIHLLTSLGTKGTIRWRVLIALLSGIAGIVLLHLAIATARDAEASMAYFAVVMVFGVFAVVGFAISTAVFYGISLFKKNKRA